MSVGDERRGAGVAVVDMISVEGVIVVEYRVQGFMDYTNEVRKVKARERWIDIIKNSPVSSYARARTDRANRNTERETPL